MAIRPLFIPADTPCEFVREIDVEFTWHPGMSRQQKQKSVHALHDAAREKLEIKNILEISSKSDLPIGRQLSAFNLKLLTTGGQRISVECAFQGSKVFWNGGPYTDLYYTDSLDAKRDSRLKASGDLVSFDMQGQHWSLEPMTLFYDWLYLNALKSNESLAKHLMQYDGFTDIEFNPKKSVNCQARSAALYVQLARGDLLDTVLDTKETYIECMGAKNLVLPTTADSQFDLFNK